MHCPTCGAPVESQPAAFCSRCGVRLVRQPSAPLEFAIARGIRRERMARETVPTVAGIIGMAFWLLCWLVAWSVGAGPFDAWFWITFALAVVLAAVVGGRMTRLLMGR